MSERTSPNVRVLAYIREYYPDGPRVLAQLKGVKSANSSGTMAGMGSATITLSNAKGANIRYLTYAKLSSGMSQEQKSATIPKNSNVLKYISDLYKNNPDLLRNCTQNDANTSIFKPNDYGFTDQKQINNDNLVTQALNAVGILNKKSSDTNLEKVVCKSMPFIDMMDMIFIII